MLFAWIADLLDSISFLPRGHADPWSESLNLIYITSSAFIALAYILIAVGLWLLWKKRRRDIDHAGILLDFIAFVAACGLTHVCDVAAFWWPAYWLYTSLDLVAAIISLGTAIIFPWVVHVALQVPTPEQFRRVNDELRQASALKDRAINDLNETVAALHRQVDHLERMRQTGLWVAEQESALRELRSVLESSFAKKEGS